MENGEEKYIKYIKQKYFVQLLAKLSVFVPKFEITKFSLLIKAIKQLRFLNISN